MIQNAAKKIDDSSNDKEVVQSLITNNIMYLMDEAHNCINSGRSTFAFPLLRQVYEYSIIQVALAEPILSVSEFVNADINLIGRLSEKIYGIVSRDSGRAQADRIKQYFQFIKQILNRQAHANIDRLLAYTVEHDFGQCGRDYFSADAEILYELVNLFFLQSMKILYKFDIPVQTPDMSKCGLRLKQLISSDELPPEVFNRLMKIDSIKSRLSEKAKDICDAAKEIKEYQKTHLE